MRKRVLTLVLALAVCLGLCVPALAEDTTSVTAAGITFDAIKTDRYESVKEVFEDLGWSSNIGPEDEFQYYIGRLNFGPEDGFRDFPTFLVNDDVTLDFHLKKGETFTMEGYYLSIEDGQYSGDDTTYTATFVRSWNFPALVDDPAPIDKDFIDQYLPMVNYLVLYRGEYSPDLDDEDTISIVFVDENAIPRTTSPAPAAPTAATVLVNGEKKAFEAYNIDGSNYFKLRDLAYVLSGTEKQFEVGWDSGAKAISLTSGAAYTAVGGEMTGKGSGTQTANPSAAKIILDGKEISLAAYEIGGNNYFKLRDIGQTFDLGIGWDGGSRTITIDTSVPYTTE